MLKKLLKRENLEKGIVFKLIENEILAKDVEIPIRS